MLRKRLSHLLTMKMSTTTCCNNLKSCRWITV